VTLREILLLYIRDREELNGVAPVIARHVDKCFTNPLALWLDNFDGVFVETSSVTI
jgi:hypothetical protein